MPRLKSSGVDCKNNKSFPECNSKGEPNKERPREKNVFELENKAK